MAIMTIHQRLIFKKNIQKPIGSYVLEEFSFVNISVAEPGCLSRILIFTHSGSRISDPGSKNSNKREG
jgi:hypothetical protein